jgi:hypothetical protein
VYVRKLRRRSDWGDGVAAGPPRAQEAVEKLFLSQDDDELSIYLINNDEDLRRVALGMNAGRSSLKEAVPFIAFLPAELAAAAIEARQTPGNLPCAHANRLHHDIVATALQLNQLCNSAMASGRRAGNCTSGMMTSAAMAGTAEGCRTATNVGACQVTGC